MKSAIMSFVCVAFVASLLNPIFAARCRAAEPEKMLSHDVYFSLKDRSPEARDKLVAACKKYLSGHPGTIWFAAGPLGEEFQRDVNDRDFDVALHIVFKNKAAHDEYSKAERHQKFIEETKDAWAKVRVFDSYVVVSSHEGVAMEGDKAKKLPLPDAAAEFAGVIQGKVVTKFDSGCTLLVEKIAGWSEDKDSNRLVGKTILVKAGGPKVYVGGFMRRAWIAGEFKVGEQVILDTAYELNKALTIRELTEEQRERVKE
jgi:hypothetical protein